MLLKTAQSTAQMHDNQIIRTFKVVVFLSFNFKFIPYYLHYELQKQTGKCKGQGA